MRVTLLNIQWHPNGDAMTVFAENPFAKSHINLVQSELSEGARAALELVQSEVLESVRGSLAKAHPEEKFDVGYPERPPVKATPDDTKPAESNGAVPSAVVPE